MHESCAHISEIRVHVQLEFSLTHYCSIFFTLTPFLGDMGHAGKEKLIAQNHTSASSPFAAGSRDLDLPDQRQPQNPCWSYPEATVPSGYFRAGLAAAKRPG